MEKQILRTLRPESRELVHALIRLRAEIYRRSGMGASDATRQAAEEVHVDLMERYQSGGLEAVQDWYGFSS